MVLHVSQHSLPHCIEFFLLRRCFCSFLLSSNLLSHFLHFCQLLKIRLFNLDRKEPTSVVAHQIWFNNPVTFVNRLFKIWVIWWSIKNQEWKLLFVGIFLLVYISWLINAIAERTENVLPTAIECENCGKILYKLNENLHHKNCQHSETFYDFKKSINEFIIK